MDPEPEPLSTIAEDEAMPQFLAVHDSVYDPVALNNFCAQRRSEIELSLNDLPDVF